MKFCSQCGGSVLSRWIEADHRQRFVCSRCETVHFQNPTVLVVSLIHFERRLLLCQRAQDPGRKQWNPPTGYLELGETLQQAAARELQEETYVHIAPEELDLYAVVNMVGVNQVAVVFRGELACAQSPRAGEECLDTRFMSEEEASIVDTAWSKALGDMRPRFFEQIRSRRYAIHLESAAIRRGDAASLRSYPIDAA